MKSFHTVQCPTTTTTTNGIQPPARIALSKSCCALGRAVVDDGVIVVELPVGDVCVVVLPVSGAVVTVIDGVAVV